MSNVKNGSKKMKKFKTFTEVAEKYNPDNDKIFERTCEMLDERLDDAVGKDGADLHDFVFNVVEAFTFIPLAEDAVSSVGTWSAIRLVRKYEDDNYGECNTPMEPHRVANMLVYIYGEFILSKSDHLHKLWDDKLTSKDLNKIRREIIEWCMTTLPDNKTSFSRPIDGLVWDEYGTY